MVWTLVPSERSKELRTEIKVGAQVFGYLFLNACPCYTLKPLPTALSKNVMLWINFLCSLVCADQTQCSQASPSSPRPVEPAKISTAIPLIPPGVLPELGNNHM